MSWNLQTAGPLRKHRSPNPMAAHTMPAQMRLVRLPSLRERKPLHPRRACDVLPHLCRNRAGRPPEPQKRSGETVSFREPFGAGSVPSARGPPRSPACADRPMCSLRDRHPPAGDRARSSSDARGSAARSAGVAWSATRWGSVTDRVVQNPKTVRAHVLVIAVGVERAAPVSNPPRLVVLTFNRVICCSSCGRQLSRLLV